MFIFLVIRVKTVKQGNSKSRDSCITIVDRKIPDLGGHNRLCRQLSSERELILK